MIGSKKHETLLNTYRDIIRKNHEVITKQDKEIKRLKKLLGLYEACVTKGVDIDFPNSGIKAEQPFDINIY